MPQDPFRPYSSTQPRSAVLLVGLLALAPALSGCFTRQIAERVGRVGWFRADVANRWAPAALDVSCPEATGEASAPMAVLVHGIGGEGPEIAEARQALTGWDVFVHRWVP